MVILMWIGVIVYLYFHREFMLKVPEIKAEVTSRILNRLPYDGVMVEGLIAYPIAYNSHKRIVVLPHDPDKEEAAKRIWLSAMEFDLKYVVFSDLWKTEEHLGYPAIRIVRNNFMLIKKIYENKDVYYIYEILID